MGSDMHMDPPKTLYRGEWQGDEWVIFRFREAIDKVYQEIWRGNQEECEKNNSILPLRPTPHPSSRTAEHTPEIWVKEVSNRTVDDFDTLGGFRPTFDCTALKGNFSNDINYLSIDVLEGLANACTEAARWLKRRQKELDGL